ncbi:MAG: hypothetical protein GKR86_13535 [Ilumatobacter sp.]|nr:hypothetical protein [Ilumatobacter sp.]
MTTDSEHIDLLHESSPPTHIVLARSYQSTDVEQFGGWTVVDPLSLGVTPEDDLALAVAIRLAVHLGCDDIVLLGTEDLDARGSDARRATIERSRTDAAQVGCQVRGATTGVGIGADLASIDLRSIVSKRSSAWPSPTFERPGERQGVPVNSQECVSAVVLTTAVLGLEKGLIVQVGAGAPDFAGPASEGWEVRIFEPHLGRYEGVVNSVPRDWNVFVDARAIGAVRTTAPLFPTKSGGGVFLESSDDVAGAPVDVAVVRASEALSQLQGRCPDVLSLSAAGWEYEILRALPWAILRPRSIVVAVDDERTLRLGFSCEQIAELLREHGYDVFSLRHERINPVASEQHVSDADASGVATHVLALPAGAMTVDTLEQIRRSVLSARHEASAQAKLKRPPPKNDQQSVTVKEEVTALRNELELLRESTSWRIGHGMVQATQRIVRPTRRWFRTLSSTIGGSGRRGEPS